MPRPTAKASKPGPRLAEEAGALASISAPPFPLPPAPLPVVRLGLELLDGHEDGPRLRPLRRADDPPLLEQVHEPAGPGEAHPQLALQHRRRPELGAHD